MKTATVDFAFYTTAMEMVPLLLIALFVDNYDDSSWRNVSRRRWWSRAQDKTYALLAVAAFFTSMFVVSGVISSSRITTAVVLAALGGTMTLLLLQIWRRFSVRPRTGPSRSDAPRDLSHPDSVPSRASPRP